MPYHIQKLKNSNLYKVRAYNSKRSFSKKGLSYPRALAQMRAIIISEQKRHPERSMHRSKRSKQMKRSTKQMKRSNRSSIRS